MELAPFENQFKIPEDSNKYIMFGEHEIYLDGKIKNVSLVITKAKQDMGFRYKSLKPWSEYKEFTKTYGITPSNFKRIYNAHFQKMRIDPIQKWVNMYAWGSTKKTDLRVIQNIEDKKDIIEQMEQEGNAHLTPFVVYQWKEPHEMKRILGKGLWKKICKNSKTRNRNIARFVRRCYIPNDEKLKEVIGRVNELPSGIIKAGATKINRGILETVICSKHFPVKDMVKRTREVEQAMMVISDTIRMAGNLEEPINENWSMRRWNEEHERLIHITNTKKYSPKIIDWLKDMPDNAKNIEHKGLKANLLMSPLDIATEGNMMGHCVGGYASSVAEGAYLVYHIDDENDPESRGTTLGLRKSNIHNWKISQHYGQFNTKDMMDERHTVIGDIILHMVNNWEMNK